jgi:hypothetical protein
VIAQSGLKSSVDCSEVNLGPAVDYVEFSETVSLRAAGRNLTFKHASKVSVLRQEEVRDRSGWLSNLTNLLKEGVE